MTTYSRISRQFLRNGTPFHDNANRNGLESTTEVNGLKVVLSLYTNQTIFIQGKGCWRWEDDVFSEMYERSTQFNENKCDGQTGIIPEDKTSILEDKVSSPEDNVPSPKYMPHLPKVQVF